MPEKAATSQNLCLFFKWPRFCSALLSPSSFFWLANLKYCCDNSRVSYMVVLANLYSLWVEIEMIWAKLKWFALKLGRQKTDHIFFWVYLAANIPLVHICSSFSFLALYVFVFMLEVTHWVLVRIFGFYHQYKADIHYSHLWILYFLRAK